MKEVTERDLRMPEFRFVNDLNELEFRNDGKIVRKDRWEVGFRNIATMLGMPGGKFEISEVVEKVRNRLAVRSDRSEQEIVDQTEELAKLLISTYCNGKPEDGVKVYDSAHPFVKKAWEVACQIQELLTGTDPKNALAELKSDG